MGANTKPVTALVIGVLSIGRSMAAEPPARADQGPVLEEIVVTAQKRAENLQNVPLAVSALSGDAISSLNIRGVEEMARTVPSLSFNSAFGGEAFVNLRGVSTAYTLAPAVGYYVDEIPFDLRSDAYSGTTNIELFDLERVEVLRGPQGTLFGAGAMGGVIRIITAKPDTSGFKARAEAEYGQTEGGESSYSIKGAVNAPLGKTVALRIAAVHRELGDYVDRSVVTDYTAIDGTEPIAQKNVIGGGTIDSVRAAVRWTPDDTWSITPSLVYQKNQSHGAPSYPASGKPFVHPAQFVDEGTFETKIANLKIEAQFNSLDLVSSSTYLDKDTTFTTDMSALGQLLATIFGAPGVVPTTVSESPVSYRQLSQEVRVASREGTRLQWIAGGYYSDVKQQVAQYVTSAELCALLPGYCVDPPVGENLLRYDGPVTDKQISVFGEATWKITDQVDLTGGLRYYDLRTTLESKQTGLLAGPATPLTRASESGWNPKVTLAYKPVASSTVYATAARGFRAGGPNSIQVEAPPCSFESVYSPTFASDSVWNYEIGSKNRLAGGQVTVNGAIYQIDWKNIQSQVNGSCGVFIGNIGTARTRGVELEIAAQVTSTLLVQAGVSYLDATLQDVKGGFRSAGVGEPGQQIINVPKWSSNLSADLSVPLAASLEGFARASWQYVDSMPTSYSDSSAAYTRPSYNNVDASLGVRHGAFEASLFGRNLTDDQQVLSILSGTLSGPWNAVGRPRTFGVAIRYSFE